MTHKNKTELENKSEEILVITIEHLYLSINKLSEMTGSQRHYTLEVKGLILKTSTPIQKYTLIHEAK